MLGRVLQMNAPTKRRAWAWFNLGAVRAELGAPVSEVRQAYAEAVALAPDEPRFVEALQRLDGP